MESEMFAPRKKMQLGRAGVIFLLLLANLLVGLGGGIAGYAIIADSDSSWARSLRSALQITNDSPLAVATKKNVVLEESSSVIDAAKKVSPAVVSVTASAQVADFFGRVSNQEIGGGTGFIITNDGLIVTNKHVVSQDATYKVVLNDGRIFDAVIQVKDPLNDLAILKIDAKDLPTVELGSSDALQIGQYVIAVGNALGEFKNSVTLGVVSAKERSITAGSSEGGESLTDLIQTDASINPGNSGGPLVNMEGQVIGINTAIASSGGNGSIGVGFAISIDSVRSAITSVQKTGKIVRPYLGVRYAAVNKSVKQVNNLSVDYGALIVRGSGVTELAVIPGSPADKAGLLENDIILEINGERIDENNSIAKRLQRYQIGQEITLKVLSKGEEKEVKVTLAELPA
jgi:serine protease Do